MISFVVCILFLFVLFVVAMRVVCLAGARGFLGLVGCVNAVVGIASCSPVKHNCFEQMNQSTRHTERSMQPVAQGKTNGNKVK